MPKKQHEACAELEVHVISGEEFEWITTTAEYCDIDIIDDHPLDNDKYHVVKGTPSPAKVIGQTGTYYFKCKCKDRETLTNPKIIING